MSMYLNDKVSYIYNYVYCSEFCYSREIHAIFDFNLCNTIIVHLFYVHAYMLCIHMHVLHAVLYVHACVCVCVCARVCVFHSRYCFLASIGKKTRRLMDALLIAMEN
jgi:hypothetical protein